MVQYGLRIRDPNTNQILLDTTDRMGRIIGSFTTPNLTPNQTRNGSVFVGNLDFYGSPILYSTTNFDLNGTSKFKVWYSQQYIYYELSTVTAAYIPIQTIWYGVM